MRKTVLSTVLGLFVLAGVPSAASAEKIMVGEPNWAGAKALAHLIKNVISTRMGYEADTVVSTNAIIYKSMDRGKGDIDIHPDLWLPNTQALYDEYVVKNQTVKVSQTPYTARSGFCVPTYVTTEMGIKSIYDLATSEGAELFDSDGNGRGEIWPGAPGWGSTPRKQVKLRDYGVTDFFDLTTADEAVVNTALSAAIKRKEAYVFSCYSPHYNFALYDLTMLEQPAYDPAKYQYTAPTEDPKWFENSKITVGEPERNVFVGYSASLEARAPDVAKFIANLSFDSQMINELSFEIVNNKREPAEVAKEWIKNNSDRVDNWLGL